MDTLIRLGGGEFVLIDDVWYDELSESRWRLSHGYAIDLQGRRMHRVIMRAKEGQIVDHINRNPLDNRKANLRFVNYEQNAWNRSGSSQNRPFKGVSRSRYPNRQWRAEIEVRGVYHDLGTYERPEHAAFVYDLVAKALCGKYAVLNGVQKPDGFTFAQGRTAKRIESLIGRRISDSIDPQEMEAIRTSLKCDSFAAFGRLVGTDASTARRWFTGESMPSPVMIARVRRALAETVAEEQEV